jgi:hypothetical protein
MAVFSNASRLVLSLYILFQIAISIARAGVAAQSVTDLFLVPTSEENGGCSDEQLTSVNLGIEDARFLAQVAWNALDWLSAQLQPFTTEQMAPSQLVYLRSLVVYFGIFADEVIMDGVAFLQYSDASIEKISKIQGKTASSSL